MEKPNVHKVLMQYAQSIKNKNVAVLLSGGIDSASIMFSLLEAGKIVTAYSFMLDGRMSTDFKLARRNAEIFGCAFIAVFLPTDIAMLKDDCLQLHALGARSKTDYECSWPMMYSYSQIKEQTIASGMAADGHFCISKKGMLHWRNRIDAFRLALYSNPAYAQKPIHDRLAAIHNKQVVMPYLTKEMQAEFIGTTWDNINRPKQKQPILDAFPKQFKKIQVKPHMNLQLGDSRIAAHFERLLQTDYNAHNGKSVVGIYNRINSGKIK